MIKTKYEDMPCHINALVVYDGQNYTIIINSRQSRCKQEKAYIHEMKHIENGDFKKGMNCDNLELRMI